MKKSKNFVITNDYLDGISMTENDIREIKKQGYNVFFQLFDDDDELYFSGLMHENCEDEFAPLDWAMYDSGCTYIKLRNKEGKMEVL